MSEPTVEIVASAVGVSPEDVREAISHEQARPALQREELFEVLFAMDLHPKWPLPEART